jgi:hypothetical protein
MKIEDLDIAPTVPMWGRFPVPWVARWTGERTAKQFTVGYSMLTGTPFIRWPDDAEPFIDDHGVRWQPEAVTRQGTPMFGELNTHRQRMAMRRARCQVCGQPMTGETASWLMAANQWQPGPIDGLTTNPPTCERCIPLALAVCPFMNKHERHEDDAVYRLTVRRWHAWGALGTMALPMSEVRKTGTQVARNVARENGTPYPERFFAKLAIARLVDYDLERIR